MVLTVGCALGTSSGVARNLQILSSNWSNVASSFPAVSLVSKLTGLELCLQFLRVLAWSFDSFFSWRRCKECSIEIPSRFALLTVQRIRSMTTIVYGSDVFRKKCWLALWNVVEANYAVYWEGETMLLRYTSRKNSITPVNSNFSVWIRFSACKWVDIWW